MELNNSSFVWWMVCVVLSVVGVCMGQSDGELSPCYPDGIFDVVENSTDNVLMYTHESIYHLLCQWTTNGTSMRVADCHRYDCFDLHSPLFTASMILPMEKVQMRIDTTNTNLFSRSESFSNSTITCMDYAYPRQTSCRTDFIFPAQYSTCTVQFRTNTSPWSVLSQCDVPKAYSALQRYSCQLFVDNGGSNKTAAGPSIPMVTKPIGNGDYVSGTCEMSADLPPEEGRYNYTVMISPGRLNVTAAFTGTNEIRRPSATLNHKCPKYVTEGSELDCTCTTSDLGGPPAKVQWSESGSSRLVRSRVPRELAGTTFTCQLVWREQTVQSLTYTVSTAHGELSPCYPDGIFDVVENSTDNVLMYTHEMMYYLVWQWTTNRTSMLVAECDGYDCFDLHPPLFTASMISRRRKVQLRIDTTYTSLFSRSESFSNSTLTCVDHTETSCRTDFIFPAQDSSCTVQFRTNTSPWSVLSQCDVTKAYSALKRYSCQLFMEHDDSSKTVAGPSIHMKTKPIGNGNYVSGTCEMTADLPPDDGRYNYTVMISPGRLNVTAAFTGTNEIRRPSSVRMAHTCPEYVDEGSNLNCTCTATDLGSPLGSVEWDGTKTERLQRANVRRQDDQTIFRCRLLWNTASFGTGSYTLRVSRQPSTPLNHTCPKYVTEGSDLDCTCTTSDFGVPPGTTQWLESGSSRLVRSRVPREFAGTTFTCQLVWREQVVQSLTYTVSTAPSGALIQQARSEGLASGMGAGVGIGLVVALVCVLVLVIVLWRRGWRLPCAGGRQLDDIGLMPGETLEGDRGANQAVEMGPPPTSSQSRELGGGAPSAGDTEDCSGSSGMYEGLQHNQMNVPSAYEELHISAGVSNAKSKKPRVYDNCAFDPDGARGGNTPNADRPRAKKGRKKEQSESPVYGNV